MIDSQLRRVTVKDNVLKELGMIVATLYLVFSYLNFGLGIQLQNYSS